MGLYEGIKDAIGLAQKADNADLIKQLLDLGAQALEMQDEIRKLKEENSELKRTKDIEQEIEFYADPYITKRNDSKPIKYCASCWVDKHKLVPIQQRANDVFKCPLCGVVISEYHQARF